MQFPIFFNLPVYRFLNRCTFCRKFVHPARRTNTIYPYMASLPCRQWSLHCAHYSGRDSRSCACTARLIWYYIRETKTVSHCAMVDWRSIAWSSTRMRVPSFCPSMCPIIVMAPIAFPLHPTRRARWFWQSASMTSRLRAAPTPFTRDRCVRTMGSITVVPSVPAKATSRSSASVMAACQGTMAADMDMPDIRDDAIGRAVAMCWRTPSVVWPTSYWIAKE